MNQTNHAVSGISLVVVQRKKIRVSQYREQQVETERHQDEWRDLELSWKNLADG
eukprot:CAMPEP_0197314212 /NCGR_PEP_ID=MMETSP0891-20130614/32702_1 /TAXON_ID=44058 ORGANISM="Aureoumbra lagunensis, Strain CCMP1510" /NCGR_SAMPLE_ID=MMETSP0891 /ASSEMBLY_ACC=CAM_ASM_000534 /LENGTH=53 /DNA_ID=CAMNT_0042802531 /DNA_START=38 /DNA_END=199 /DNA_ORIENTATION=-